MMDLLDDIAIVGYAETPSASSPGAARSSSKRRPRWPRYATQASPSRTSARCSASPGTRRRCSCTAPVSPSISAFAPRSPLRSTWAAPGAHHMALAAAATALRTGQCTAALCTYGENGISVRKAGRGRAAGTLTGGEDFEMPYGLNAMITQYALLAQRHVHRYGTTSEQMGAVAVTSRYHASLNPNAHKRGPASPWAITRPRRWCRRRCGCSTSA